MSLLQAYILQLLASCPGTAKVSIFRIRQAQRSPKSVSKRHHVSFHLFTLATLDTLNQIVQGRFEPVNLNNF